jgi:LuxR family transcriptional regulator, maltose regulon positive regulatory protein
MARNGIPLVSNGRLLLPNAAEDQQYLILVGSDTWYTWLTDEQNRSFSFRAPLDTITVRREQQRNGWY